MIEVVPDQTLPNVTEDLFAIPTQAQLAPASFATHKPRILMLYGSVRGAFLGSTRWPTPQGLLQAA